MKAFIKDWKTLGIIISTIIILAIPFAGIKYYKEKLKSRSSDNAEFVGAKQCIECHETAYKEWEGSHHANSMAHATDSTVLADFNDATFTSNGIVHRFYKRDGNFYTFTRGKNGNMEEYRISHTFGYTPLQQYLVPFEKGKYQCLPIAWDAEKKEWFDMGYMIYGIGMMDPDDWLYWTNQAQNWNGMCAECHSTNLKKNYRIESDSFSTTWSEINVSCEACHGPSSKHIEWANMPELRQSLTENYGLVVKTSNINNEEYVNLCARCHTRRSQLGDFQHPPGDIMDFMIPTLLHEEYYPDGQILDENYVYGSFVQSKMYDNDVQCNDCHNVHSGERFFDGNKLCFQCHKENYYGTANHHFHKNTGEIAEPYYIDGKEIKTGEGASCVNCHMPARYYMGIDLRNDHSFRVPRPDLTKTIGTPNTCNQCHTDKSTEWAIKYVQQWYGDKHRPHYGTAISGGREGRLEVLTDLKNLVIDTLTPLIVRSTALELLANYEDTGAIKLIRGALYAPGSMLRLSAVRNYLENNIDTFIHDLAPLLTDPAKSIRMESALKFSYVPQEMVPEKYKDNLEKSIEEYIVNNEYMADFPGGRSNLGLINLNLGNRQEAIKHYEKAIEIDNRFYPAYINLALLYNQIGRNMDAEKLYKILIEKNVDLPEIYYSLGLLLAEEQRFKEAAKFLLISTKKIPDNARINYNLGLLFQQLGNYSGAREQLILAREKEPLNFDYIYALTLFYLNTNEQALFRRQFSEMEKLFPDRPEMIQLRQYVK